MKRHVVGNKIRDQSWQANTEVHILAGLQEVRGAQRHEFRRQAACLSGTFRCFYRPALGPHELQHLIPVERFFTPDKTVDKDTWGGDRLWVKLPWLDNFIDLSEGDRSRSRKRRVKIARRTAVDQIAGRIRLIRPNEGKIGPERGFQQVGPAIKAPFLFPLRDDRANPGGREKRGNPRSGSANALDQGSLGHDFKGDFAPSNLLGQRRCAVGIAAEGGDQFRDLAGFSQNLRRQRSESGRVADNGQVAHAAVSQGKEQFVRPPLEYAKPAYQNTRSVPDIGKSFDRGIVSLLHTHTTLIHNEKDLS